MYHFNVAEKDADEAYEYIRNRLSKTYKQKPDDLFPHFIDNYKLLKGKLNNKLDIPRRDMPKITNTLLIQLIKKLKTDYKHTYKLNTKFVKGRIQMNKVFPSQREIYLEKVCESLVNNGITDSEKSIFISKEGYIVDGHHRFAKHYLHNPNNTISAIVISLPIALILNMLKDIQKK